MYPGVTAWYLSGYYEVSIRGFDKRGDTDHLDRMDRRGNAQAETVQCSRHMQRCPWEYEREERRARGDRERRGDYKAKKAGSEFSPLIRRVGNVRSKNWAKGDVMRRRRNHRDDRCGDRNDKTAPFSVVGGGSGMV